MKRPFGRGTTRSLGGLTITMVINHVSKSWDDPPSRPPPQLNLEHGQKGKQQQAATAAWVGSSQCMGVVSASSFSSPIWKGSHTPILRGRNLSPWLLTMYTSHGMIHPRKNHQVSHTLQLVGDVFFSLWRIELCIKPSHFLRSVGCPYH